MMKDSQCFAHKQSTRKYDASTAEEIGATARDVHEVRDQGLFEG